MESSDDDLFVCECDDDCRGYCSLCRKEGWHCRGDPAGGLIRQSGHDMDDFVLEGEWYCKDCAASVKCASCKKPLHVTRRQQEFAFEFRGRVYHSQCRPTEQ